MEKFWMIANVAAATELPNGDEKIEPQHAPKYIHMHEDAAEQELIRLQQAHPSGTFVLLEAMSIAKPRMVMVIEKLELPPPF
ncbi:hypothetical protein [Oryzomonas rubra]|uniref:Uncharacterized protein n=1 Tax=Oryzomonas rubra TaxID=2509454 RepID=A0A5A9X6R7_9BACT|nr:hypothetical protein [Oryzomonas rubra]KAA0888716.1 hypothetical protein ET418_15155 [Oryzomonas rubra]